VFKGVGCIANIPLPSLKWENIGTKTFNSVFIVCQNSVAYNFMSLNDFSIVSLGIQNSLSMVFSFEKECLYYCATTFLVEDFNINFLIDELASVFFIEECPKTYVEAMRSIDASF